MECGKTKLLTDAVAIDALVEKKLPASVERKGYADLAATLHAIVTEFGLAAADAFRRALLARGKKDDLLQQALFVRSPKLLGAVMAFAFGYVDAEGVCLIDHPLSNEKIDEIVGKAFDTLGKETLFADDDTADTAKACHIAALQYIGGDVWPEAATRIRALERRVGLDHGDLLWHDLLAGAAYNDYKIRKEQKIHATAQALSDALVADQRSGFFGETGTFDTRR